MNPNPSVAVRRKPRYVLGTFWLLLTVVAFVSGVSGGGAAPLLLSPLLLLYSIYLYRGGRWGLIIW